MWSPKIARGILQAGNSLHLTDKEVEAQRGAGTCPRSLSKVKEYLGYLWQGKAYTWRKSRES